MVNKKFIIVTDSETADKMINCGFQLVSKIGNQHTFLNQTPKNFKFSDIDLKKICYSNILSI